MRFTDRDSALSQGTIVIIDDSKTVLLIAARVLQDEGYDVIPLSTAVGAVTRLRQHRPDLLLLDLSMPELDGEKLLQVVADLGVLPNLTVLLYSDQDVERLRMVAARSGAEGYIQKGDLGVLIEQVNEWMSYQLFA